MTEQELKIKKLELEVSHLAKAEWKKPTYIISVVTVIISALIGFGQYYTKVNSKNIAEIKRLKNTIEQNKEQQHKMEIATSKYETLLIKTQNEEEKKKNQSLLKEVIKNQSKLDRIESNIRKKERELLSLKKKHDDFKSLVKTTVEKYKKYSPGYANGIISSQSGQTKIHEIMQLNNLEKQKAEIEKFAFNVMNQTNHKTSDKVIKELGLNSN